MMKLQLDEEEVGIIECVKEVQTEQGFHIRDVIKRAKTLHGMSRTKVYEIVGYLEFHSIIKTNKAGHRELDETREYFIECQNCGREISGTDYVKEEKRIICEECYMGSCQQIKQCDPWAARSVKLFRKQAGLEGTEGLTDLQQKIYEFILSRKGVILEEIIKKFEIPAREAEDQLAILNHCELVKRENRGDGYYLVPFDSKSS